MSTRPNTPHRTVTEIITGHFREKKGYQAWRDHGTDDFLLIYSVAGKGYFGYPAFKDRPAGEIETSPGDLVLIKPGTRHDYGVAPPGFSWELVWAHFQPRPHWLEWLSWPEEASGLLRLRLGERGLEAERAKVEGLFRQAHQQATSALRRRSAFALSSLEQLLLWCDAVNPETAHARMDERVRAAMDFLCRHLSEPVPLEYLAGHVNLSVSRFSHLFRAQAGVTPQQFVETQRLSRAKQLLELTPHAIKQIAREVGFENPFYFTLRFKRYTGVSPREYRARVTRGELARGGVTRGPEVRG